MRTTEEAVALIKGFEGCSLTAYQDQGRVWTVGWGCTRGVGPDTVVTQERADALFLRDLFETERLVTACTRGIPLNENQFSALVSFCYNVGFGVKDRRDGFQTLKSGEPSTMLRLLRVQNYAAAALEFQRWSKVGSKKSNGLLRRRRVEQALFLKPVAKGVINAKD